MNSTSVILEYSPQQKAAHLTRLFANGERYTVAEVAEMFGMTDRGARSMLDKMSGAIPLVVDEGNLLARNCKSQFAPEPGRWRRFDCG